MHPRAILNRSLLTLALAVAACSAQAETAPTRSRAAASPWKTSTARPHTATVHVVRPAPATAGAHVTAPAPATAATISNASAAGTRKNPRRLEDVSIEGEVPVPQVLFVTAREQRRGIEFQQHRYLPTARALGEATPLPRWIATPQNPPPSR